MKKRLLASIAAVMLVVAAPGVSVIAVGSDGSDEQGARQRDIIWQGLWAGANFDVGHIERKKRPPPPAEPAGGQPQLPTETVEYAALGDSVAAGAGLGSENGCDRSTAAYPSIVAEARGLELTHVACSGATMGDLLTEQRVSGPNPEPQLDVAFAAGTPKLITITAGANDVQWQRFLRKCYARTCGTSSDERIASVLRSTLEVKLYMLFRSLDNRSQGSPPEVILTGYYNPLSTNCSLAESRVSTEEIDWLNTQLDDLNQTLEMASSLHGYARFVPIDFSGHDICSADPWIQGLDDPAPFHPTTRGQEAIAEQILSS